MLFPSFVNVSLQCNLQRCSINIAHINTVRKTTHYTEPVSTTHYPLNSITYYFRYVRKPAKGDRFVTSVLPSVRREKLDNCWK
jgi:hypothetical protein